MQKFQDISINTEIPVAVVTYSDGASIPALAPQDYFDPSKFSGSVLTQAVTLNFSDQEL